MMWGDLGVANIFFNGEMLKIKIFLMFFIIGIVDEKSAGPTRK